jgi:hypothetical protein
VYLESRGEVAQSALLWLCLARVVVVVGNIQRRLAGPVREALYRGSRVSCSGGPGCVKTAVYADGEMACSPYLIHSGMVGLNRFPLRIHNAVVL